MSRDQEGRGRLVQRLAKEAPKLGRGAWDGLQRNVSNRLKGALGVLFLDAEAVMSPAQMFDEQAKNAPDRPFLMFEGQTITYGEMRARVISRAHALKLIGVGWADTVAVVMSNHPNFVTNVLALSWLGATSSLVNTSLHGEALKHAILLTQPKVLIASPELAPTVDVALATTDGGSIPVRFVEGESEELEMRGWSSLERIDLEHTRARPPLHPVRTLGEELFAYIFTSGTTGLPKAGKIPNARARTAALGFGLFTMGLAEDDVLYVCLPLFHASGLLIGLGATLASGATLALSPKLRVSRFWDDIADTRATAFVYIGEVCRYLALAPPHPRERDHRLRCIVGNGMRPEVWGPFVERFRPGLVHEFYGATEGNVNMTNLLGVEGSVGRMPPLPGLDNAFLARFDHDTEQPVRDAKGRCVPCKRGEVGELLGKIDPKRATTRFDGYLGKDATNAKILRDVVKKGDAYFRSGDLMRKDWLGFYYFVDRIGDTFRWKGENVSTNQVGDVIMRLPEVEIAAVYGVEVPGSDGRAGMAALSLKPGAHFSPEPFYAHVARELASFAMPVFVRLLPEASVTATFKLKKTTLQDEGFDPRRTEDLVFVRDDARRSYELVDFALFERISRGELRV